MFPDPEVVNFGSRVVTNLLDLVFDAFRIYNAVKVILWYVINNNFHAID